MATGNSCTATLSIGAAVYPCQHLLPHLPHNHVAIVVGIPDRLTWTAEASRRTDTGQVPFVDLQLIARLNDRKRYGDRDVDSAADVLAAANTEISRLREEALRIEGGRLHATRQADSYVNDLAPAEITLRAIAEFANKHEHGATRWADPLPIPEWVLDLKGLLRDGLADYSIPMSETHPTAENR